MGGWEREIRKERKGERCWFSSTEIHTEAFGLSHGGDESCCDCVCVSVCVYSMCCLPWGFAGGRQERRGEEGERGEEEGGYKKIHKKCEDDHVDETGRAPCRERV